MVLIKTKRIVMKILRQLDRKKQEADKLSTDIEKLEKCLKETNSVKYKIECMLQVKRKKYKKLKQILSTYLS